MLTVSIDTLVALWTAHPHIQPKWNPEAPTFVPAQGGAFQSPSNSSKNYFQKLSDSMRDPTFASEFAQLVGEWSAIDFGCDDTSVLCMASRRNPSIMLDSTEQAEQQEQTQIASEITDDHETFVLDVLRQSLIEKVDFYPKDRILQVQPLGENSLEVLADDEVMASARDIMQRRGLGYKFTSHLNETLMGSGEDWEFLQKQLDPVMEQMRPKFHQAYAEHLKTHASDETAQRRMKAKTLRVEAVADILASLKSGPAVDMATRHHAHISRLLQKCIEEVFSSIERERTSDSA